MMMNMHERIMAGKLFTDMCEGMPEERTAAKLRMKAFNDSMPDDPDRRAAGGDFRRGHRRMGRAALLFLLWAAHQAGQEHLHQRQLQFH